MNPPTKEKKTPKPNTFHFVSHTRGPVIIYVWGWGGGGFFLVLV